MLNSSTLENFTGSATFTRHMGVVLTEGALYVAKNGGTGNNSAFWLMDVIASLRFVKKAACEAFQVCKLTKKGTGAVFTVEDGNDKVVYRQAIPYTDFDFSGGDVFTLWAVMGEARTVMLPSEY